LSKIYLPNTGLVAVASYNGQVSDFIKNSLVPQELLGTGAGCQ